MSTLGSAALYSAMDAAASSSVQVVYSVSCCCHQDGCRLCLASVISRSRSFVGDPVDAAQVPDVARVDGPRRLCHHIHSPQEETYPTCRAPERTTASEEPQFSCPRHRRRVTSLATSEGRYKAIYGTVGGGVCRPGTSGEEPSVRPSAGQRGRPNTPGVSPRGRGPNRDLRTRPGHLGATPQPKQSIASHANQHRRSRKPRVPTTVRATNAPGKALTRFVLTNAANANEGD
jgi:hypothetical protein